MKKFFLITIILITLSSCFFDNKKDLVPVEKENISGTTWTQSLDTNGKEIILDESNTWKISVEENTTNENISGATWSQVLSTNESSEVKVKLIDEKIPTVESVNIIKYNNEWDQAYWKWLQDFIKVLMKNPDILKDEDCSKYDNEVEIYCKDKQIEYKEIFNKK